MLPNLGLLALRAAPTGADEDDEEEVLDSGVVDEYTSALGEHRALRERHHRRRRLAEATERFGNDEVGLVLNAIVRSDASKTDICEKVRNWCALNKAHREGCEAAGKDFWTEATHRLFPKEIWEHFKFEYEDFTSMGRWPKWIHAQKAAGLHYPTQERLSFYDACYGYSIADALRHNVYTTVLERAEAYYLQNNGSRTLNEHVVAVTGVDSQYGVLKTIRGAIEDAYYDFQGAPGLKEYRRLLGTDRLFTALQNVFVNATEYILFREHNHLIMLPAKEDPEGVDTADEAYPFVRLKAVAELVSIHVASTWRQLRVIRDREESWLYTGNDEAVAMYSRLNMHFTDALFGALFPSDTTLRGLALHDLPLDSNSNTLYTAMMAQFNNQDELIAGLARPYPLEPGEIDETSREEREARRQASQVLDGYWERFYDSMDAKLGL
jgi:hypothetical protein